MSTTTKTTRRSVKTTTTYFDQTNRRINRVSRSKHDRFGTKRQNRLTNSTLTDSSMSVNVSSIDSSGGQNDYSSGDFKSDFTGDYQNNYPDEYANDLSETGYYDESDYPSEYSNDFYDDYDMMDQCVF